MTYSALSETGGNPKMEGPKVARTASLFSRGNLMWRKLQLGIAISASLLFPVPSPPGVAFAASAQKKPFVIHRWHGYGFLPGYHQPPNNSVPVYASRGAIQGAPDFTPRYWDGGGWYYFGAPRFVHGRWNGGGFGPCWTYTPIGPMWNCG
jgi:hypothetical protein